MDYNSNKNEVLHTLAYSDVFDFPLTRRELWYFLKSKRIIKNAEFTSMLYNLSPHISSYKRYYCLKNREEIIQRRISLKRVNAEKISSAKKIAFYLSLIPTVQFIGLSGSLAAKNAEKKDDIDFFIIVSKNSLWISRLLLLVLLQLIGKRRNKHSAKEEDLVCINMILEENMLTFPSNRQDMYTAHEFAQLRVLIDKKNIYDELFIANRWVADFMPNLRGKIIKKKRTDSKRYLLTNVFLTICNDLSKWIQMTRINKTKTTEIVTDTFLAFHPFDYRMRVLRSYNKKLQAFQI